MWIMVKSRISPASMGSPGAFAGKADFLALCKYIVANTRSALTFGTQDCGHELFVDEKPSSPSLCRGTQGQIYSLPASDAASQSQQPPDLHSQNGGQEQRNTINSQNTLSTSKLKNSRVELNATTETDTSSTSNIMLRERGFLLMCVNTGRFMTKLSQIETTYLGNDYVLFSNLRASYEELRGSPLKSWSLYHPSSARLVRVGRLSHIFAD